MEYLLYKACREKKFPIWCGNPPQNISSTKAQTLSVGILSFRLSTLYTGYVFLNENHLWNLAKTLLYNPSR